MWNVEHIIKQTPGYSRHHDGVQTFHIFVLTGAEDLEKIQQVLNSSAEISRVGEAEQTHFSG